MSATRLRGGRAPAPRQAAALAALVVVVVAGAAQAASDARLSQAEGLAKKQETGAAADIYRGLVKDGVDGPGIRYNLGTLCLEQGDIGEAVLHLLTARRMAPGDGDVRHNLSVALDARVDRLAGEAPADPVRAVGARVPPLAARLALAVPLFLLGALLAALAFVDRGRAAVRAACAAVFALAIVGGAVYLCRRSVEGTREAVVLKEAPALREPDDAAAVSFTAHPGLYGDVVEDGGPFVRIRFENGLEAWMKSEDLGFVD